MKWLIISIVAESILFPLALIWALNSPGAASTSVLVFIIFASIAGIAAAAMIGLWNPLANKFPTVEPGPDAVSRSFQSFSYWIVNLGLSVHATADADFLHLTPVRLLRWVGAKPTSIPWSAMEPVKKSRHRVRVNGHVLQGPKWCMELANPPMENEG